MLEIPFINKKLFVVTDIHGNLQDFNDYLNLWLMDKSNHIVFTGDLIHHDEKSKDKSLEILDLVRVYNRYSTFHVLLIMNIKISFVDSIIMLVQVMDY